MNIPDELKRFNLEHAKREVKRRLILTSEGGPATGKTNLFYKTAPRPALVIQLDLNDEGVREQIMDDDKILFKNVIVPPFTKHDEAQRQKDMAIYNDLRDLYRPAVTKGYFRSIMIDEGAALYTLVRRAFLLDLGFGGSSQQSYAPVNSAMDRFYTLAKQHRVNLYIPHRQTDEREAGVNSEGKKTSTPTGRKTAAGWKESLYTSQCHLLLTKDERFNLTTCAVCDLPKKSGNRKQGCTCDKFVRKNPVDKFSATVLKCTARTALEGRVLTGDEITWQNLGQLVFPHSEESDWV